MTDSKQETMQQRQVPLTTGGRSLSATSLILAACLLPACVFIGSDKHAKLEHASDHQCDKTAITVQRPVPNVAVTQGCGIKDATYYHVLSQVSWRNSVAPLLERVRFERACDDDMTWTVLNETSLGISTCGARMVYVSTIDGWVLNSKTAQGARD